MEMVDLLPLDQDNDLLFVEALLREFSDKTGSKVAQRILAEWPQSAAHFTKVGSRGRSGVVLSVSARRARPMALSYVMPRVAGSSPPRRGILFSTVA